MKIGLQGHATALDAHTLNIGEQPKVGEYLIGLPHGSDTTFTVATGLIFANLVWVARDITIDRIAIETTGAAGVGGVCYLGIYNVGTALAPTTLRADYGTLITTPAAGIQAITIAAALPKGYWWFAITHNNSAPVATCRASNSAWSPLGYRAQWQLARIYNHVFANHAYAALPATFPAAGLGYYSSRGNLVLPRVASLA